MDETSSASQQVSPRYKFRYNGKALRIYHDDAFEQVTLAIGGTFN